MSLARTLAVIFLLSLIPIESSASAQRKRRVSNRPPTRTELKQAERRLADMGYPTGPVDGAIDDKTRGGLVLFQKWEGRKLTGQISRSDFDAIMDAEAPQPRDPGYAHVEVDVDRQLLLLIDSEGAITKMLPVSTGSNKQYNEKGIRGLAYTPRGRFRVYAKIAGWRKSPLGLLYYPNYFSGVSLKGSVISPDKSDMEGTYGKGVKADTVLAADKAKAPQEVRVFPNALAQYSSRAAK